MTSIVVTVARAAMQERSAASPLVLPSPAKAAAPLPDDIVDGAVSRHQEAAEVRCHSSATGMASVELTLPYSVVLCLPKACMR